MSRTDGIQTKINLFWQIEAQRNKAWERKKVYRQKKLAAGSSEQVHAAPGNSCRELETCETAVRKICHSDYKSKPKGDCINGPLNRFFGIDDRCPVHHTLPVEVPVVISLKAVN